MPGLAARGAGAIRVDYRTFKYCLAAHMPLSKRQIDHGLAVLRIA